MNNTSEDAYGITVNLLEFTKLLNLLGIIPQEGMRLVEAAGIGMVIQREQERSAKQQSNAN